MKRLLLLIEDMPGVRESLSVVLANSNFEIDQASDGEEGLNKAKTNNYDLVITDILLPKVDGNEIIIASKQKDPSTPVIAISAGGHGVSADQALTLAKHKADGVLMKPFSKDELIDEVKRLLG